MDSSGAQSWTVLEAILFLSVYSIASYVQPQGYFGLGFELRKNDTMRLRNQNWKLQSWKISWGAEGRGKKGGFLKIQCVGTDLVWFIEEASKRSSPESRVSYS